jgi:hypothetical protein
VLLAIGATLLVVSHQRTVWAIIGGSAATTVGMLLLAPFAVTTLGRIAGTLPVAGRLALRDLVRNRARSGAAVGAAALALGIACTVSVSAAVAADNDRTSGVRGNLPTDELMIYTGRPGAAPTPALDDDAIARARAAVDRIVAATGASASVELEAVVDQDAPVLSIDGVTGKPSVSLVHAEGPSSFEWAAAVFVATDDAFRFLGIEPSSVASGIDVITTRRDLADTVLLSPSIGRDPVGDSPSR